MAGTSSSLAVQTIWPRTHQPITRSAVEYERRHLGADEGPSWQQREYCFERVSILSHRAVERYASMVIIWSRPTLCGGQVVLVDEDSGQQVGAGVLRRFRVGLVDERDGMLTHEQAP